ncbi:MAG TPA: ABC transporter substrate-binding protein [Chloroflexota bacterium]|nr:ABC transporter substrate-binding protein [Chloroflexota bacterium]
MNSTILRAAACLVLVPALLAPRATQARPPATPGVTASMITIGGIIDHSGFGQTFCRPIEQGDRLVIDRVNAAGGINGRKIRFITEDDSYVATNTLPAMRKLAEQEGVFAILQVCGSDGTRAVLPYTESHGIPFFDPVSGEVSLAGTHWTWVTQGQYRDEAAVIARYAFTTLHARRIGLLYQAGEVGDPALAELQHLLPRLGASLVTSQPFLAIQFSFAGALAHLRAAHPDLVIVTGIPTALAGFMKEAARVHYRPPLGFIGTYPLGDQSWIRLGGPEVQGMLVSAYGDISGRAPATQAFLRASGGKAQRFSAYEYYGFYNTTLFTVALRDAGRDLTRAGLRHALDTNFRDYQSGNGPALTFTPTQHLAANLFALFKVTPNGFTQVTGYQRPLP